MTHTSLELFLDRLDPAHRPHQLAFFRIMHDLGTAAIAELAPRVQRVACPPGLKLLTLEHVFYHPEPEWIPVVERILRYEQDLALFTSGAHALGRMRTPASLAALRSLSQSRAAPAFRETLNAVLQASDPAEAFKHHFARLLQGSAQSTDANEGAHQLASLLSPESLEPLKAAVGHPDPLIFRHALRLVGLIPTAEAADFLLAYFEDTHAEALEDRDIRSHLAALRSLPRLEVLERCVEALSARAPDLAPSLSSGQADRMQVAAQALRASDPGLLDTFLLDTLTAARDEKPATLTRHLALAGEAAQPRARRLEFGLDAAAQGLALLADQGHVPAARLIPLLAESLRHHTGRAGVAAALAHLVDPGDGPLLDLLLEEPEGALRSAAIEALGLRKDPALHPVLAKLRRDPIAELAQRALWHLGQLPDPEGRGRAFLAQADPEEVRIGLRFVALHKLEALLPELLELAEREGREDLQLRALETLAAVGCPAALDPLLALLHSGQAPRFQVALAESLRDLGLPEGALALCGRAFELNQPLLHAIAVEALAHAHGAGAEPLAASHTSVLLAAVRAAWSGKQAWVLRRRIGEALVELQLDNPGAWAKLAELFHETLAEKRAPGELAQEEVVRLQTCARILAQRGHS